MKIGNSCVSITSYPVYIHTSVYNLVYIFLFDKAFSYMMLPRSRFTNSHAFICYALHNLASLFITCLIRTSIQFKNISGNEASKRKMQWNPSIDTYKFPPMVRFLYIANGSSHCESSGGETDALRVQLACLLYIMIHLFFAPCCRGFDKIQSNKVYK